MSPLAPPRLRSWWPQFEAAELCYGVNPFLLAAIVDRESLGGQALVPIGPGGTGDNGNGLGLGQIDRRFHPSFAGATFEDGHPLWADPTFNLLYSAHLLASLLATLATVPAAVAAYNAGEKRAREAIHAATTGELVAALDAVTTGGDYVSDVLGRCLRFGGPDYLQEVS